MKYAKKKKHMWLTWIRDADKKATVRRALGKVLPPFIRWITVKKMSWPGITKRKRTWADRWFAPAILKMRIRICMWCPSFKGNIGFCNLNQVTILIFTWTNKGTTRAVAPPPVFRNLSWWVIQMQTGGDTTRLDGHKVSSNTYAGMKQLNRVFIKKK